MKTTVSIIIPTYNRCKLLKETIYSFQKTSYPHELLEMIIADNHSQDSTKKMVQEMCINSKFPIIYHFEEKQGVHFARNAAAKIAKGEFLYYTDDDMIAEADLIYELVKTMSIDPCISTATGRILPEWETTPPNWVKKYMENAKLSLNNPPEELIISKRDCMIFSCHQMIRKEAFFKAGGYNPENTKGVWIGDGETGLNLKLEKLGYKFAYTGKSVIRHFIPRKRMTLGYLIIRLVNQANSDSYTDYRRELPSHFKLIKRVVSRIIDIPYRILILIKDIILLRDGWRIKLAVVLYHMSKVRNEISLIVSKRKRDLVLKDDWLKNPICE